MNKDIFTVKDLLEALEGVDPKTPVFLRVDWAKDTIIADEVSVSDTGGFVLTGWKNNCNVRMP